MKRFAKLASTVLAAVVLSLAAGAASALAAEEYVPFVTDFPAIQPGSDATEIEGYVTRGYEPFVSDFPAPRPGSEAYEAGLVTRTPVAAPVDRPAIEWVDFGIGVAVGIGAALMLAAAGLLARGRRPAHG